MHQKAAVSPIIFFPQFPHLPVNKCKESLRPQPLHLAHPSFSILINFTTFETHFAWYIRNFACAQFFKAMHIHGQPIWPLIKCCRKFSADLKLKVDG